jgi:hypothetical protein
MNSFYVNSKVYGGWAFLNIPACVEAIDTETMAARVWNTKAIIFGIECYFLNKDLKKHVISADSTNFSALIFIVRVQYIE